MQSRERFAFPICFFSDGALFQKSLGIGILTLTLVGILTHRKSEIYPLLTTAVLHTRLTSHCQEW